jgi:uracil-DNA glycosylase family 4
LAGDLATINVIKCRPKGNRTPTVQEGSFCANLWLDEEIHLIKPQVIVALGGVALHYLGGPDKKITKERGKWFQNATGIWTIATFHPAYLLRLTGKALIQAKWNVYYDLQAALAKCREIPEYAEYQFGSEQPLDLLGLYAARRDQRCKSRV